jgi:hypothetical protein
MRRALGPWCLAATALWLPARAVAQEVRAGVPAVAAHAVRDGIAVDGRLNEPAWIATAPATDFKQRDPDEGAPATEQTELRILYDERAVYVGVRLFDRDPSKVVARISRRDNQADADRFTLYLDPYHDHLTGVMFEVSAAGVQYDAAVSADTMVDASWDAVWESAISRDSTGWTLEIRIPLTQLRFSRADRQTWGINAARFIQRKNETSWLALVPKMEFGLASRMTHLDGLEGIRAGRNIELLPYVRASTALRPAEPGNPFNGGSQMLQGVGVDVKYGISSNVTLNATANPDFGQVEVDPAVVNLSAFETFFPEKRQFFLEGSQIFNGFGRGGGIEGPTVVDTTHFYSRRIGRSPQGFAFGDFVDTPASATILGAVKLSGKFAGNWTLGILDAVTDRERATTSTGGERAAVPVEPQTNYLVARLNREFPGRGALGMMLTDVERQLTTPALAALLPDRAQTLGGDGYYFFDRERVWGLSGRLSGSWVRGSSSAIDRLQRAPARYFQRPDRARTRLNASATSINGWSGSATLGKTSGGWTASTSLSGNSPGFETNDLGFHTMSDAWGSSTQFRWHQLTPDRFSRSRSLEISESFVWTFDGDVIDHSGTDVEAKVTFLNYWLVSGGGWWGREAQDDRLTRGGPAAISPRCLGVNGRVSSDGRRLFVVGIDGARDACQFGSSSLFSNAFLTVKPSESLLVRLESSFNHEIRAAQYLDAVDDPSAVATFGTRYVFAAIDQRTATTTGRVELSLSPRLSLQTFTQILFSKGRFGPPKALEAPRTFDFAEYRPAGFPDPDFDFKSLRANAVFRWEWRPGSTTYLVWTHTRDNSQIPGAVAAELFRLPSYNVFLIKTSWWFSR